MSRNRKKEVATHRRYIRIDGKLIAKCFLRKTDADEWYSEKKREKKLIEGGIAPAKIELVRLDEYAETWMAARKAQGKPESSWCTDERRLRLHIIPSMGHRIIQQITRREWEQYLTCLVVDKKMHPTTRNRVQSLLSKLYNDALRQEVVVVNPLAKIPKLRESQDAWDYWHTKEECAQYLEAAKAEGPVFHIYAMLALNTGARVGEVMALRHEDVRLENRSIHIWRTYDNETKAIVERTKGKAARWLGMNEALHEALLEYKQVTLHKRDGDLLVYRDEGAGPTTMTEGMIRRRHLRVCERAGLKPIRIHDLRHTYASHYMMSGGNLSDLQGLLGHASSEMTQKYSHLAPGHLESKSNIVSFGSRATTLPREAAVGGKVIVMTPRQLKVATN